MIVVAIAVLTLFFLSGRWSGRGFFADYVDKDAVLAAKGVFILLVTLSHFSGYAVSPFAADAAAYKSFQGFLRQMVVVPFLFFSGYGVSVSLRDKGGDYFRRFPVDRMLGVLFKFDLAVLPFFALALASGRPATPGWVVGGFTAWTSFGNSNWYIFTILSLYLASYLSFLPFGRLEPRARETAALVTLLALVPLYALALSTCRRPEVFFNTAAAYAAGAVFAVAKRRLEEAFLRRNLPYAFALALSVGVFLAVRPRLPNLLYYEVASVAFAAATVLVLAKVRCSNRLLVYCGRHLFAIYILQRLPMILLKDTPVARNAFVYLAVCLASTLAAAAVFDCLADRAWGVLRRRTFKTEKGKMRKVITYGTYDLLHWGHINLLRRARELGDYLIVVLSTDEFNWNEKRKKCQFPYEKRKMMLEAVRYVDEVIPETCWEQKRRDVQENGVSVFVMGDDWKGKFDFLSDLCEVVYLPRTPDISTTQIKRELEGR